jgi:hypothetical protein
VAKEPAAIRKTPVKRFLNFLADLIAASMDRGSHGCKQIFVPRTEYAVHFPHRFLNDAGERASPTRMDGGYGSLPAVRHDHWHAVGRANRKQDSRFTGDQSVARRVVGGQCGKRQTSWQILKFPSASSLHLIDAR